jgi:excisionase family DNA binding protein
VTKPPSKERFLSIQEVAEVFGVNIWTVKKWLAEGKFSGAFKLGTGRTSPWRIPQSAIDTHIRQLQKERD